MGKKLDRVLKQTHDLLSNGSERVNYEEVHSVKSLLYAAIEHLGCKIERLASIQRQLRELFMVVTCSPALNSYEREAGKRIIEELMKRYSCDILEELNRIAANP